MEESKKHSQSFFILMTSLSFEDYKKTESFFNNNETKNCSIYHKKTLLSKFQFISEHNEETSRLFPKENNFKIELPENLSPKLIPMIIHFLYFQEVKALQFGEIVSFLELAIFFRIKNLQEKIMKFLKETVDTAKKAIYLRTSLSPLMKRAEFTFSDSLKELFIICETFLIANNHMKEYFFLFIHQYYSSYQDYHIIDNLESDLFSRLELMKRHKANGKYMLKLLFLYKDRLCVVMKNEIGKFDFKVYAKGIIEKYVELGEINKKDLIKLLAQLELKLNDFPLYLATEKTHELKNETNNLKENSQQQIIEMESDCEMNIGLFKNEFEKKKRMRGIRNNILLVFGVIIIYIIFKLKNDREQNVIQLKKNYERKPLTHEKENENNLDLINHHLQFSESFNDTEQQKEWEKDAIQCLKEKKEREDQKIVLLKLIASFKTIHEDHKKHFQYLAELLNLKTIDQLARKLHLIYRGTEQNFSSSKFHELSDWKGATITLFRSRSKKLFGGYASIPWHSNGNSPAPGSFLFSLSHQTKHVIYRNSDKAMHGDREHGPSFGEGYDLILDYDKFLYESEPHYSNLGGTYTLPDGISYESNEAQSYLAGSRYFGLEEYEVFGLETKCWQGTNS